MTHKGWRRSDREGGWSWRKDGRVDAYVTVDTASGSERLKTTKKNPDAANAWIAEMRHLHAHGGTLFVDASDLTVGEYVGLWLDEQVRENVRPVTFLHYASMHRSHILPRIGERKLRDLSAANVRAWKAQMLKEGVGPSSAGSAMRILKRALAQAVSDGAIPHNPARDVKPPRYRPGKRTYVKREDVPLYLRAVRGEEHEALYVLAATGGPRSAELRALRWEDWDAERAEVTIDEGVTILPGRIEDWNDPKTDAGRRTIPLTRLANSALKEHHRGFKEKRMQTGARGDYSRELVFANPNGGPLSGNQVRERWYTMLRRAGLPRVTIHEFRHTAVMLFADADVDLKTVQGIMGHEDPLTTLRHYTHFVPEKAKRAARLVDDLLPEEGH
jgi:integrase